MQVAVLVLVKQQGGNMQDQEQEQERGFSFTGTGGEYFRIWIVNLFLTIITLGIYSAWAKVRRLQYFYRNTWLNDSSFDFHGKPIAILKGRLIAVGMFVAYNVTLKMMPMVGLSILLLIIIVMPVLLVKSFRFRLYYTSYRGLRFGFFGSIKSAYFNFLALPVLTVFTMFLLTPFTYQRIKAYQHNHSRFGQSDFSFKANAGQFYLVYLQTFLLFAAISSIFAFATFKLASGMMVPGAMDKKQIVFIIMGVYLLLIIASLLILPFFISRIQNLVWNSTMLAEHRFKSTLSARGLLWIILSNFIFIILSIGLFKPFADIRMARYRVQHMALLPGGNLEEFIAAETQHIGATGIETAEIFDLDISL
jgi:uncharacterized membrane protein YjgN (DUF898 family)